MQDPPFLFIPVRKLASQFIPGHSQRSTTRLDLGQLAGCLLLCGPITACATGPSFKVEGRHATVQASSQDSAQRIASAVDRAWGRTPAEFADPGVERVEVELVKDGRDGNNRTLYRIPMWGRPQLTMCLLPGSWARAVGHEVVHARTLLRLKRVPPILWEGLAEYWSFEPGPLRDGLLAYADRVVSQAPMPPAYFELSLKAGDLYGRGIQNVLQEVTTGPEFDANLLKLTSDEIQQLGWSEMQIAYHLAHAMVHDYLVLGSSSTLEALQLLPDEAASDYYERIGIGSLAEVRERARQRTEGSPLIRAYWPRLVGQIDDWLHRYPQYAASPETFFEQTAAILEIEGGERLDLNAMEEFRELVRQVWHMGGGE